MINKTIGLVLARSGSKGIKDKNIKLINNKPLFDYSIKSLVKSKICSKIIVSTDSSKYINIIKKKYSKNFIFFKRSKKYAKDNSSSEEAILEILNQLKKILKKYKYCVFFQLTSPLVKPQDFKDALNKFQINRYDSLFTGYQSKKFCWHKKKSFYLSLNYNYKKRPRRQDFKGNIVENGAFYIFNLVKFKKYKNRLFGKIGCYFMSENRSLEIDNKSDVENFKLLLKKNV